MKKIKQNLEELKVINCKYGLSEDDIITNLNEMSSLKICTPFIGGFSTGKSSLINALLEKKILKTKITPETAIPTEIYFGLKNQITVSGMEKLFTIDFEEFKESEFSIEDASLIQIEYQNSFFEEIKNINIVDMPGLDSGIEIHNRAIFDYLNKSLAYIIVFSADDMIIKESIAEFLKELKLFDIPICIVITKSDKVTDSRLQEGIVYLKENLPKYIDITDVPFCVTAAKKDENTDELKIFLRNLNNKSDEIFCKKYNQVLNNFVEKTEMYLDSRVKNESISVSNLEEKEQEIKDNITSIVKSLETEKQRFSKQAENCINVVKQKLDMELDASQNALATMIVNGHDITDKVNTLVRGAASQAIKKEFEPRIQKYLENVGSLVSISSFGDTSVENDALAQISDSFMQETLEKTIPVLVPFFGAALGGSIATIPVLAGLGSLIGPVGTILGASLGSFIGNAFRVKKDMEKKELALDKIRYEIIPKISQQVCENTEIELKSYIEVVNENIALEVMKKRDIMLKSLEDIKLEKNKEKSMQENTIAEILSDLNILKGLKNG